MTKKDQRVLMEEAIKSLTIPFLKEQNFKGSFPHFRRFNGDRINLLTFQFSTSSPKFVVEISNCSPKGILTSWGKLIKPSSCTAHDMYKRIRIGSITIKTDYWFDFSKESIFSNIYNKKAKEVIELWSEAEKWWYEDPSNQRNVMVP